MFVNVSGEANEQNDNFGYARAEHFVIPDFPVFTRVLGLKLNILLYSYKR
jgi:hypothetical protein